MGLSFFLSVSVSRSFSLSLSLSLSLLGDITTSSNLDKKQSGVAVGKENVPNKTFKTRTTRLAARKLSSNVEPVVSMEVENVSPCVPVERVLPPGVKDIDEDDGDNPQLCSEYAFDTYVYLKQLETRAFIPSNYLSGCPANDKMRAVLIDWLVEVQIQFSLLGLQPCFSCPRSRKFMPLLFQISCISLTMPT